MSEHHKIEILDYFVLIVKWKKVLLTIFFTTLITVYLLIRFFVGSLYEASATIIPIGENSMTGLLSLVKDFSAALPGGLGDNLKKESEMNLYNTLIYSRTSIENLINKYDLMKLYKIKKRDEALKAVRKTIKTSITLDNAYIIKVRSKTPQLASDMTNFLVNYLNEKVIELNISKSKDNRQFLEQRYNEIKQDLANAEDSLKSFQERTGIFEAENQTKATIETFAKLESELAVKQVELSVIKKIYGENSPNVSYAQISADEYQKNINKIKRGNSKSSLLVGLNSLPEKALDYYRYYRDVEILNEMLKFIVPLYEQSKFDEQKMVPILQVIDYAVPPEKRVFPKRTVTAGVIASIITLLAISYIIFRELLTTATNPKIIFIRKEFFNFK